MDLSRDLERKHVEGCDICFDETVEGTGESGRSLGLAGWLATQLSRN